MWEALDDVLRCGCRCDPSDFSGKVGVDVTIVADSEGLDAAIDPVRIRSDVHISDTCGTGGKDGKRGC